MSDDELAEIEMLQSELKAIDREARSEESYIDGAVDPTLPEVCLAFLAFFLA